MPTRRAACTGVVFHESQMIVVGGVDEGQTPVAAVDCFNIESETWEQLAPLPVGVVGPYVVKVAEKIYCFAGTDKKDANQSVVYDMDRAEWSELPKMATKRYACGGYLRENKVYIVGGRDVKDPVKSTEVFDLETQQWETLEPMGSVRVFYNTMGIKDTIYAIGGLVPMLGLSKIVEKYDIKKNKWTRIKDLPISRSDGSIGVVGGRVVIASGLSGDTPQDMKCLNIVDSFTPRSDGSDEYLRITNMRSERASTSTVLFEDKMAVVGGAGKGGPQKTVELLQITER